METCPSFPQFLQELAVLSQRQAEKLAPTISSEDEDKNIFKLADFFRTMTPSDCYDFALRLHLLWKKKSNVSYEKQQGIKNIIDIISTALKRKAWGSLKSGSTPRHKLTTTLISYTSESDTKFSVNQSTPTNTGNLYNYLYNDAQRKNYTKMENEQRKFINETKDCTFQPNLSKSQTTRSSVTVVQAPVFSRLYQDLKKEKAEINEMKKLHIEMKGCTFTPILNSKRLLSEEGEDSFLRRSPDQTFDRLYKEHQLKRYASIENELKKQELESKECTFQPILSARNTNTQNESMDRCDQLYKLHSERQKSLIKKRIEKSEEEASKYSFKPSLVSSPATAKKDNNNKKIHERLQEWNEKKNRKLEIKIQEKIRSEKSMTRELNLPMKKDNENDSPHDPSLSFNRLYNDGEAKKTKIEMLEKRVLREIGASFTPKTNGSRNSSANKVKDSINTSHLVAFTDLNLLRDGGEERANSFRQKSPVYKNQDRIPGIGSRK